MAIFQCGDCTVCGCSDGSNTCTKDEDNDDTTNEIIFTGTCTEPGTMTTTINGGSNCDSTSSDEPTNGWRTAFIIVVIILCLVIVALLAYIYMKLNSNQNKIRVGNAKGVGNFLI